MTGATAEAALTPDAQREQAAARLSELGRDPDLRVVAASTTGLKGVPVEVVVLDAGGGIVHHACVAADRPIEPRAGQINGLTDADLVDAEGVGDVAQGLEAGVLAGMTVVAFHPQFIREAFERAGAQIDAAGQWSSGQALLSPVYGAWDDYRADFGYVSLAVAAERGGLDDSDFEAQGSALGNAQRLHALIFNQAFPEVAASTPEEDPFCPGCDQPLEHCGCER